MLSQIANSFEKKRSDRSIDPHCIEDERATVLWVLDVAQSYPDLSWLTPGEISRILREVESINIPWQRVSSILKNENKTVATRKVKGARKYKIMKPGSDVVQGYSAPTILINPDKALSEIRRFEEMCVSFCGEVKICDPYIENRSLDLIAEMVNADRVCIMTQNVLKESKLRRDLLAFEKEHEMTLEIRVNEAGSLHDRYVIHNGGMLLIGCSLNGLGKKQAFIVQLGEDIRQSVENEFDRQWSKSRKFA